MRMDDLLKIKELVAENPDDLSEHQIYAGIRNGVIPVIQVGPKYGYRLTRELWKKFKNGEYIDNRYFLKPAAQKGKKSALREVGRRK